MNGQHHIPAALYPLYSLYRRLGGPQVGLEAEAKGNILSPVRDRTPVVQFIVRHYPLKPIITRVESFLGLSGNVKTITKVMSKNSVS
jgi:hypothetical protein